MIDPPRFEQVGRIDSTNAELMRRPFAALPAPPCILLADEQLAGRGRNGRAWLSDVAGSLTMSVAVERSTDGRSLLGLPLVVGVSLAQALAAQGASLLLKWPNDLYRETLQGPAKAGGILIEVRQFGAVQRIVAGWGLNLQPRAAFDARRTGQATAAVFEGPAPVDRPALAQALGARVATDIHRFARDGLAPFLPHWRALDLLADRPIDLLRPDGRREPGVACGVDSHGALVVQFDDGRREHCIGGEVSVRMR